MKNPLRHAIPSMFHRRLLLLIATVLVVGAILLIQMVNLTVAKAGIWRERAESALVRNTLIDTVRGRIIDRAGRVLAVDRPSYDVAVHYSVISGQWAYDRARLRSIKRSDGNWATMDDRQREALIDEHLPFFDSKVDQLWQVLADVEGVELLEIETRRSAVVRRVQRMVTHVWDYRRRRAIDKGKEHVALSDFAGRLAEQDEYHPIVQNVEGLKRIELDRRIDMNADDYNSVWRLVRVVDSQTREYPLETITVEIDRSTFPAPIAKPDPLEVTVNGVGIHFVGAMRRMWAADSYLDQRPFSVRLDDQVAIVDYGGYREGDNVGSWGIERAFEYELRGQRGEQQFNRETKHIRRREPIPGQDVQLSIDIRLQARVMALMSHDPALGLTRKQDWHIYKVKPDEHSPLNGAAVVLDIPTGQVLSAVTLPGFNRRQLEEESLSFWRSPWAIENRPRSFRPVATSYYPGSTIKPVLLAAAYSANEVGLDEKITCEGALDMSNPAHHRCWIFKLAVTGHGPLDGPESIRRSCNVFYYTLGQRFGPRKLVRWYSKFGLGSRLGCGLPAENPGRLPSLDVTADPSEQGLELSHAIQMGIGQGPVEWTPLQAANAYATLARGGVAIRPTFIKEEPTDADKLDLNLSKPGLQRVIKGMDMAVNQRHGTAHQIRTEDGPEDIIKIEGIHAIGKSGTAFVQTKWVDYDLDGRVSSNEEILKEPGDHAWCICIITRDGETEPAFVVAVVMEHAGSGGAVSGPIVNQILHAMRAEGYL